MQYPTLPIDQISTWEGNPRQITQEDFNALVNSLLSFPQMLFMLRPLVLDEENKTRGGNMRIQALKHIATLSATQVNIMLEEMPSFKAKSDEVQAKTRDFWANWLQNPVAPYVRAEEMTEDELREFVIKDNVSGGTWDFDRLANEWDADLLTEWGMDVWQDVEPSAAEKEQAQDDDFDENEQEIPAITKAGDLWQLGQHRLLCGDSTKAEDVQRLMAGEYADLWLTDPPYNVDYSAKNEILNRYDKGNRIQEDIKNDRMSGGDFLKFLTDAFTASEAVMRQGAAFYVWFASREHINFETALNRVGLKVRQELIWNKNFMVIGMQDYQWKHEPCQPAGTMVLTTEGEKPIETLKDGDHVVTYDKSSGQIVGYRNGGFEIKTASRDYDGNMYYISADGKTTRATDNHQFSVRFNAEAKNNYVTYLMKRGNWWRVGVAKAYDARQFGMKSRYHGEKAEAMWAITTHKTREEAQIMEQVLTCKYGIPYTVWETGAMCRKMVRTDEGVAEIYAKLDLDKMANDAHRLLEDHGRKYELPLICEENKRDKFSCRVSAKIHACNLLPEIMQLPIPTKGGEFIWASITSAKYKHEKCKVYSLAVDKHQHYIADGIVTHNCLYGWKEGAAHFFTNSRSELTVIADAQEYDFAKMKKSEMKELLEQIFADTTPTSVINEKKPARSEDHPTMKPVRLFGYQIANSSKKGDIVLDTFGGSGTTIIACEQLGRKARVMELDPHYCDVIIARWEKLTGCMAVKINANENEE